MGYRLLTCVRHSLIGPSSRRLEQNLHSTCGAGSLGLPLAALSEGRDVSFFTDEL